MRRLAMHTPLLLGFSLLAAVGCTQGAGERCQGNSDCASGLVCIGANPSSGYAENGKCEPIGSSTNPTKDAGRSDTRRTDTALKSDTLMTDALPTADLGIVDETRYDAKSSDTTPSPAVDALRADTQTRADARADATVRTDSAIDAPVADAPADVPSPGDAASDGALD